VRDEIVDLMARAIYAHAALSPLHQPPWEQADNAVQDWIKEHTRYAIRALESSGYRIVGREPTEEMVDAMVTADRGKTLGSRVTFAFQAAFDAAPLYGGQP